MDVTWRKCICTIGNAQKFGSQKSAVNCQQGGDTAPALLPAERYPQGSLPCPHAPPWSPAAPRWPSPARSGRRSRARRSRARRTCRGSWSGTRSPRPTSLCWSQTANKIWAERTQSSSALKLAWSPLLNKVVHMRFTPGKLKSTFSPLWGSSPRDTNSQEVPVPIPALLPLLLPRVRHSSSALLPWLLEPGTRNGFESLLQRNLFKDVALWVLLTVIQKMETQSVPALKYQKNWKFKLQQTLPLALALTWRKPLKAEENDGPALALNIFTVLTFQLISVHFKPTVRAGGSAPLCIRAQTHTHLCVCVCTHSPWLYVQT